MESHLPPLVDALTNRILEEKAQLDERLLKLKSFIESDAFKQIDPVQQDLLIIQKRAMETYSSCLDARITRISNRIMEGK